MDYRGALLKGLDLEAIMIFRINCVQDDMIAENVLFSK